ncbi:MAG TPA: type VI secretion system-associated FHA domain protein TagH [Sphingomonas sp.]
MTLTLSIRNTDRLDNGAPAEFVLNRRGAMIGRSPTCDWSLPDPRNYISSRHCEVTFRDGFYLLSDVSTNGTFLNGRTERMGEPRRIVEGDLFLIGQYEVVAHLTGDAVVAIEREQEQAQQAEQAGKWSGWGAHGGDAPVAPPASGWDPAREIATPGGFGGMANHAAPLSPAAGGWGAPVAAPQPSSDWGPSGAAAPPASDGWGAPPASDAVSPGSGWAPAVGRPLAPEDPHLAQGRSAMGYAAPMAAPEPSAGGFGGAWAAPTAPTPPPPGPSTWESAIEPPQTASGWSSAAPDRPPPPSTNDVWGALAAGNVVDWATSGFGQPLEENSDPLGLNKPRANPVPLAKAATPAHHVAPPAAPPAPAGWANSPVSPAVAPAPSWAPAATEPPARAIAPVEPTLPPTPVANPAAIAQQLVEAFAQAAGLKPGQLRAATPATLDRAAQLMRRLVGGLVVMVEARARAKSQMGAEATSLSFDGNNPIKFARTPEQALAQLLNPPERGFMDADKAIDDAFFDLQSHQMATLKAMQGALRATLDRFSPTAIRGRAEQRGLFQRIMPGAREAALWQAYEREFGGVAQGSDEAFMDVFAKEFRRAYEEQARGRKR